MSTWQACASLVTVITTTLYVAKIEMSTNMNLETIANILIPWTLWFFLRSPNGPKFQIGNSSRTGLSGEQEMVHTQIICSNADDLPKISIMHFKQNFSLSFGRISSILLVSSSMPKIIKTSTGSTVLSSANETSHNLHTFWPSHTDVLASSPNEKSSK